MYSRGVQLTPSNIYISWEYCPISFCPPYRRESPSQKQFVISEHTTPDGEAARNDEDFSFVSVWEFKGVGERPALHKEPLEFENVQLSTRSYK